MRKRPITLFLLLCAMSIVCLSTSADARPRRYRFQPATQPCPPTATTTGSQPAVASGLMDTDSICPLYVYMQHTDYCSYFAYDWDNCVAQSYDSTDCSLHATGCNYDHHTGPPTASQCGCLAMQSTDPDGTVKRRMPKDHPGHQGYGKASQSPLAKKWDKPDLPGSDPEAVKVTPYLTKVIRFKDAKGNPVTAQVFVAYVLVLKDLPCHPVKPVASYVSRATQIEDARADSDLTGGNSATESISPTPGLPFAYTYTLKDPVLGPVSMQVIMHHKANPHGK